MADIVVRGLEDELVRRVRSDAALRGENLKDWMERVLEQETSGLVRKGKRQANGQKPYEADGRGTSVGLGGNEPQQTVQAGGARGVEKSAPNNFPKPKDAEVGVCKRCNATVRRDPKNRNYWKCISCRRQLDDTEVC
jgi:hypothetical protein